MAEPESASEFPETKHQHYVPRFYLRRFVGPDNLIRSLDIQSRRLPNPTGPAKICQHDFFYGLVTGERDEVSQRIERGFQGVEDKIASRLPSIEATILNRSAISDDDKEILSLLISLLWIRGPAMRNQVNEMSTQVAKKMMEFVTHSGQLGPHMRRAALDRGEDPEIDPEVLKAAEDMMTSGEYDLKWNNSLHLRMLNDFKNYARLFSAQYWYVLVNESQVPFVTADNPVAVQQPPNEGIFGTPFMGRTHHFALNPQVRIVCTPPATGVLEGAKSLKRRTLFARNAPYVEQLNLVTASQAIQFVYADRSEPLKTLLDFQNRTKPLP